MNDIADLLHDIERWCRRSGTAESTFGRLAVNDGKLVSRLRGGKGVTVRTLHRVREFMRAHAGDPAADEAPRVLPAAPLLAADAPTSGAFRFFANRQRYLAFVNACNEKQRIARRAGHELQYLRPAPPALRLFDAGMGDATVLSLLLRDLHRRFSNVPLLVVAKELSPDDLALALSKMPDRFLEHPATVLVVTNLNYTEAPRLMPRDLQSAAALNWHEVRLTGNSAHEYAEQMEGLEPVIQAGWRTHVGAGSGNPVYVRPSVLVIYRDDQRFLLAPIVPQPGRAEGRYDFILASQPWRSRAPASTRARNILAPLTRSLAPGGRLLGIQSYGEDAGLELVRAVWPDEAPFPVRRHDLLAALKEELGRDARDYNLSALADAKSIFRFEMHSLPAGFIAQAGMSTLFSAWNAAIYVNQIDDDRLNEAVASGAFLAATRETLQRHQGLWFNDESFVISHHRP
ncbi:MAG: hypothetical protein AB7Q97_17905 [Gammaproteobacteria bacterium]